MHRDVSGYIPMHIVFNSSSSSSPKIIPYFLKWSFSMTNKDKSFLAIEDRSNNYFLQLSIGFSYSSNHSIKNNLAFISAGVPGPHIFDHENKLGPRSRDDGSVARVQRVCDVIHLGEEKRWKLHWKLLGSVQGCHKFAGRLGSLKIVVELILFLLWCFYVFL